MHLQKDKPALVLLKKRKRKYRISLLLFFNSVMPGKVAGFCPHFFFFLWDLSSQNCMVRFFISSVKQWKDAHMGSPSNKSY